jgi:hypothetical protein
MYLAAIEKSLAQILWLQGQSEAIGSMDFLHHYKEMKSSMQ